ncbi:MAG TPA: class I SAM-dependent methyltransferase [Candidatus Acidoferrum sp.]|jgi:2-polyprenyl-3-methyl-5-hydroxy-6-metoxy-1,4-benzoquinol methylase
MQRAESIREEVISANVEFYREIAGKYDEYESCASEEFHQRMLESDLNKMQSLLAGKDVRCLDCGGGSGNLTLKMLERGWKVTVVDVSPDMLELSKAKVHARGFTAEFVNDSVENFLAASRQTFSVISFSSVLHHLYAPADVVREMAGHVEPGGFFYSNFDPVLPSSRQLTAFFYNLDTILAKVLRDRRDLLPGIVRRLKKLKGTPSGEHDRVVVSHGDLAEYHARTGLDDGVIAKTLKEQGFATTVERYAVGRTKTMLRVNRAFGTMLNFRIMARREESNNATNEHCTF